MAKDSSYSSKGSRRVCVCPICGVERDDVSAMYKHCLMHVGDNVSLEVRSDIAYEMAGTSEFVYRSNY